MVVHLFVDATRAFNQTGFLLGGFVLLGLGLLVAGHEIHWRLHAARVPGRIKGVREKAGIYYSVYGYTLPATGAEVEATSDSGSSSLRGRATGRRVPLLVFPDRPDHAEPANSWLATSLGAILALPGALCLWLAFTAWPVTAMTWVLLGLYVVYAAFHLKRILIPKDARLSPALWKAAKQEQRRADLHAIPVRQAEAILSSPRNQDARARQAKTHRVAAPLLLLCGLALVVGAVWIGRSTQQLAAAGQRATGVVVSVESQSSSDGGDTYYPIVRFTAENERTIEFRDKVGTNPPLYHGGERVTCCTSMPTRATAPSSTAARGIG